MKSLKTLTIFLLLISFSFIQAAPSESELLGSASDEITGAIKNASTWQQKLSLKHSQDALKAAQDALKRGDEKSAKKLKKKALRWYMQAIRECISPGKAPENISEALKQEKGMYENAINRMHDLIKSLLEAKKAKEKSDFPFFHGLAINQIMLALDELITGGWDGWHPGKALDIYLNAAANCEDVQKQIKKLLDYLKTHADTTGITDISSEACDKAKEMVDELYKMKKDGAPFEDIIDMAEKIKKFLDDEGSRIGRLRREKGMKEAEEEEKKEREERVVAPFSQTTTTVKFTSIDGETNVNKKFTGEIQKITFVATDGKEIDPKEVDPDIKGHGDSTTVSIGKGGEKIKSIILQGTEGIVRILQDKTGVPPVGTKNIATKDGIIEVGNERMQETFNIAKDTIEMDHSAQEHLVTIEGNETTVVAARNNQIAVAGEGVQVSTSGVSNVQITNPSNETVNGLAPSWGYNVNLSQETTKTNVPVQIMADVFGLAPTDMVTFRFVPESGQTITPQEVTMPASALLGPIPVATSQAHQAGEHAFHVQISVERTGKETDL